MAKIAVLDTSRARKVRWKNSTIQEAWAAPRLLELLEDGYTVYIASTRSQLYPEGCDKCLFDRIPSDRFFYANHDMDTSHAHAPGLIDLWTRVLTHLDIPIPEHTDDRWERTWMDLRYIAQEAGVIIR